ncbi:MAG: type II secretion system protein GspG, partial [Lentisphaerae bacterium]|nr:type II secretion system protein GspG [Lentisphaerota bacterium]
MLIKKTRHNRVMRSQFTLIELLIVIGLLGALTALILPSLMADREEALGDVCDYNQAGTVRVLKQFKQ